MHYTAYIAMLSWVCCAVKVGIRDAHLCNVCVYHVGYNFNSSPGTITDHSKSANDIDMDPYFKSHLCADDTGYHKVALI